MEDNPEEDIVANYLTTKTEEIKTLSLEAKKELNDRKTHREKCLKELKTTENFGKTNLEIAKTWQKVSNAKWIVGYQLKNKSKRSAKNIKILLKPHPSHEIQYSWQIFTKYVPKKVRIDEEDEEDFETDEWIQTNDIKTESTLIISLDLPNFLDTNTYRLSGVILFERIKERYQEPLKDVELSVKDLQENLLKIKVFDVAQGSEEGVLSTLVTSILTKVHIKIPEGIYRTLDGLLQLDCCFNRVEVVGRRRLYLFDGNSEVLEGAMIRNLGGSNLELYTRSKEQLYHLLHHLYRNIPDVVVYDESCEVAKDVLDVSMFTRSTQNFLADSRQVERTSFDNFVASFDKQLEIIESSIAASEMDQKEYKEFRKLLSDCEKETDCLYSMLK